MESNIFLAWGFIAFALGLMVGMTFIVVVERIISRLWPILNKEI